MFSLLNQEAPSRVEEKANSDFHCVALGPSTQWYVLNLLGDDGDESTLLVSETSKLLSSS